VSRRSAIILAVIILAAALRFYSIGSKSLWLDEIMSVGRTQASLGRMISEIARADGHPPLYYILQYATRSFPKSEGAARVPSALAGIATVWLAYCIGRRLLGPLPGLAAAGLSAVSAFQVYYSQEARPYALAMMLAAASLWLLLRIIDRSWEGKSRARTLMLAHYAAYTLVSAAMLYTHYYLAFALLAEGAIVVLRYRTARAVLPGWLATRLAAALLFVPYLPVVLSRAGMTPDAPQQPWWKVLAAMPAALAEMLTGIDTDALGAGPFLSAMVYAAAFAPPAAGAFMVRKKPGSIAAAAAYLLLPVVCVVLLPWRLQVFEAKHLAFAAPMLMVAAAAALVGCERRPLPWLALVVPAAFNIFALSWYYNPQFQKERWPEAGAVIARNAGRLDAVIFNPPYLKYPFAYYYDGRKLILPAEPPGNNSDGQYSRFWYVEEMGSNVAPADRRVRREALRHAPAEFFFGGKRVREAMLPGRNGTIVIRLLQRQQRR